MNRMDDHTPGNQHTFSKDAAMMDESSVAAPRGAPLDSRDSPHYTEGGRILHLWKSRMLCYVFCSSADPPSSCLLEHMEKNSVLLFVFQ